MKTSRVGVVLILWAAIFLGFSCAQGKADDGPPRKTETGDVASDATTAEDKHIVEENPDYMGPSTKREEFDDDDDVYSDDEGAGEESDADEEHAENELDLGKRQAKAAKSGTKSQIGKALSKTRKSSKKKQKAALKLLEKHGLKITLAVGLFAFRREVYHCLWHVFSKTVKDPKTGTIRRVVNPTSILKILVFIDIMRRIQKSGDSENGTPLLSLIFTGSRGNLGILGLLIYRLLIPGNTAYVPPVQQHYTFERVNERYKKDGMALKRAMHGIVTGEKEMKSSLHSPTSISKLLSLLEEKRTGYNGTVILLDWTRLDSSLSRMSVLRDEISFLLSEYRTQVLPTHSQKNDSGGTQLEVVVLLESPGGSAPDYALAAQQIIRLRTEGIKVTICVDKVAASGGYMIACASSPGRLFAAPFAILGGVGVIGQTVNIHKTLEGWGVKPLVFRGGRDKAPVGLIGEVTREGIKKVQDMVDSTHRAFKRHVATSRPVVADRIEELSSGDIWLGFDALDRGLIDRIVTSDEYIGELLSNGARVIRLVQVVRPKHPFTRPTTSTSVMANSKGKEKKGVISFLSDFRDLFERAAGLLVESLSNDEQGFPATTRGIGVSDLHLSTTSSISKQKLTGTS